MILSNNNGTFTPVAGGTGTFVGTKAAFDAVKATLPVNTVAYITDDAQDVALKDDIYINNASPFTSIASGNYTATTDDDTHTFADVVIPADGWYLLKVQINNKTGGVVSNYMRINLKNKGTLVDAGETSTAGWTNNTNSVVVPLAKDAVLSPVYFNGSGSAYEVYGNYDIVRLK